MFPPLLFCTYSEKTLHLHNFFHKLFTRNMATFSLQFMPPKKDGTRQARIILYHNKERVGIPTGIFVDKKDITPKGAIKDYPAKEAIDALLKEYRDKCNQYGAVLSGMTTAQVKELLTQPATVDFIAYFRRYINATTCKGVRNYKSALNALLAFLKGADRLDVNKVSYTFLKDFESTLKPRAKSLYMACIRKVFNQALMEYNDESRAVIKYNPFMRYKIPKINAAPKRALPLDVIRDIIRLPYTQQGGTRRDLAKDCFILSLALMGMNSVDLYNAATYKDGYIIYNRTKTRDRRNDNAEIHVKVQPCIRALFDKYRGKKRVFNFHARFSSPESLNRAINIGLGEITEELNKRRPADCRLGKIQFYAARHSFATIAYNDVHIDKYTVNDMLNHTDRSMAVTDLYIRKDFTPINEANGKVLSFIFGDRQ